MQNDQFIEYLKAKTGQNVNISIVEKFVAVQDIDEGIGQFTINLNTVANVMGANMRELKDLLESSHDLGTDYKIFPQDSKGAALLRDKGRGNDGDIILLTSLCYKSLCMQVDNPNGDQVREYYMAIGNFVLNNFEDIFCASSRNRRERSLVNKVAKKGSKSNN